MSLNINSNNIFSSNWVKVLGIKIDSRRNFELHVSDLCKSAAIQLNILLRLKSYLTFEARKILIESVQKRALRFLFDDYESSYETLLMKAEKPAMTVQRLRYLCAEIYRTVNGLNPSYMKNVFKKSNTLRSKRMQHQNNLSVPQPNYYEFDTKRLASFGPNVWDSLSINIKSAETFKVFKKLIGRRNA